MYNLFGKKNVPAECYSDFLPPSFTPQPQPLFFALRIYQIFGKLLPISFVAKFDCCSFLRVQVALASTMILARFA
jgi:hypothetical protein